MTLAALLLSSIAFDAAPAQNTDQVRLQGTGGIIIIKDPVKPKEKKLQGTGGIIIIKDKKPK